MVFRRPATLALIVATALVGACDRSNATRVAKPGDGPNVLLITLDTTRADRLGCYGHAEAITPALDELAASGVRLDQAFCAAPLTLPSHTSLLTGTYPPTHGVHINGSARLPDDLPTLAEVFKDRGYRTGAFLSSWVLNADFGLRRGFDHYDDRLANDQGPALAAQERSADRTCDAALAWLDQEPQRPFFAWVHFFDPHAPYAPPPAFLQMAADPYDGEIAFMDTQVARLVEWLDAHGCRAQTLIVAAADHGEALGEHKETVHGLFLYDVTLRVPLIFSMPGRLPAGKVVPSVARLVDVAPTILDLLGSPPLAQAQGQSLCAVLETGNPAELPAYGETEYPLISFGWARLRSYTTERWKYIAAPRPELYDRSADPGEEQNVIAEHTDVASRLKNELEGMVTAMPTRTAETVALDEQGLRALQSLGYVGGSAPAEAPEDEQDRRDPKDMVRVFFGIARAAELIRLERHADAVRLLEPLAAISPESDELHGTLAEAYRELGRLPEAERAYRASLRNVPNNAKKLTGLAEVLRRQNRLAEAVECLEQAAAAAPNYAPPQNRLGTIFFQQRDFGRAARHFRRYLEILPNSVNGHVNLATVLLRTGQYDEVIKLVRWALQRDPTHVSAHQSLWQALNATQHRLEAIAALRTACRALPDNHSFKRHLAALLANTPQLGAKAAHEAIELAKRCCAAEPDLPESFDVLGIAYAAAGDAAKAIESAQRALTLAQTQGNSQLAAQIAQRLRTYQTNRP